MQAQYNWIKEQIAENNEYLAREGLSHSEANDRCREKIWNSRVAVDAIRTLITPAARTALDVHPITAHDAARVEHVAFSLWKAEAERAAPNVARNRTPEMFLGELESTRAKWLSLADAAMRAIAEGK